MSVTPGERDLLELFGSLTPRELRAVCFDSMRGLVGRTNPTISPVDLGRALVPKAAQLRPGRTPDQVQAMAGKWVHCVQQRKPELLGVAGFLWSLVGARLAVPEPNTNGVHLPTVVLTGAAWDFVNSGDPHPLLPGAVARVKERCPGLPDHVVDLLSDASECLSHGLNRPAIALLGFAYEAVIVEVLKTLDTKGIVQQSKLPWQAVDRLKLLRSKVGEVFTGNGREAKEARDAAELACDLADKIRDRRNRASHPSQAYGFQDHDEIEEYLTSGFRRLPDLWAMTKTL